MRKHDARHVEANLRAVLKQLDDAHGDGQTYIRNVKLGIVAMSPRFELKHHPLLPSSYHGHHYDQDDSADYDDDEE
jgi:hypothetical protein